MEEGEEGEGEDRGGRGEGREGEEKGGRERRRRDYIHNNTYMYTVVPLMPLFLLFLSFPFVPQDLRLVYHTDQMLWQKLNKEIHKHTHTIHT